MTIPAPARTIAPTDSDIALEPSSQPGESIDVSLQLDGDDVVLRVANVAPPILENRVEHLFEPFRERDEASMRNRSGLGLGLYIASKIALEHDGTLVYRYESGRVCFYARLSTGAPAASARF